MTSGVYERTAAHRKSMRRAQATIKSNGSEAATSRRRADSDLADFTSARIAEAVKRNDFSLARAWIDLSESINKSE
jgi:hypothetical protein